MNQLLATMAREREARKNLANPINKKRKIDERSTIDLTVVSESNSDPGDHKLKNQHGDDVASLALIQEILKEDQERTDHERASQEASLALAERLSNDEKCFSSSSSSSSLPPLHPPLHPHHVPRHGLATPLGLKNSTV